MGREYIGDWSFSGALTPGFGLVLSDIRHQQYPFANDVRVSGIWIGRAADVFAPVAGATEEIKPRLPEKPLLLGLGAPELPKVDDAAPVRPVMAPFAAFPDIQFKDVSYKAPKHVAGAGFDIPELSFRQTYLFTGYSNNPSHEPGSLVNGARFYPLVSFKCGAAPPDKAVNYVRVDYRLEFALEPFLALEALLTARSFLRGAPIGEQPKAIKDLAGLFRDNDQLMEEFFAFAEATANPLRRSPALKHPLAYIFDNIEKPLKYEVIGEGVSWGEKGAWDNFHLWVAKEGLPPTPGANHAAHIHWRWGTIAPFAGSLITAARKGKPVSFGGINGAGTPVLDPRIPRQRLRVAVTRVDRGPGPTVRPTQRFKEIFEKRTPETIPDDGTALVAWMSVEAVRPPSSDPWEGTFFAHGSFFTHDLDVLRLLADRASKFEPIRDIVQPGVEALHAARQTPVADQKWERPHDLED